MEYYFEGKLKNPPTIYIYSVVLELLHSDATSMYNKVWLNKKKLTLKKIFCSAFLLRQLLNKGVYSVYCIDKVYSGIYSNMWDSATIEQYEDGK